MHVHINAMATLYSGSTLNCSNIRNIWAQHACTHQCNGDTLQWLDSQLQQHSEHLGTVCMYTSMQWRHFTVARLSIAATFGTFGHSMHVHINAMATLYSGSTLNCSNIR